MVLKYSIVFENNDFIVINKSSGLLSIPDREGKEISLKSLLKEKYGEIFTVHRLDRGTSGIIVFAKNALAHKNLSAQFSREDSNENQSQPQKIYLGLVKGSPPDKKGIIDAPIAEHPVKKGLMIIDKKGKPSITEFEVIDDFGIYSWLRFQIHTGRTHQIRVHMKHYGYSIVCDELYGDGKPILLSSFKHKFNLSKNQEEEKPILNRLALHSSSLQFTDQAGKTLTFEASLPKDLKAILQQLEKRFRSK